MNMVQVIKERQLVKVKWEVMSFLDSAKGIQILDISWIHADSYWHCIITYFTVE